MGVIGGVLVINLVYELIYKFMCWELLLGGVLFILVGYVGFKVEYV